MLNQREDGVVPGEHSPAVVASIGLAIAIGVIDWWGSRYTLNPDGISYVEMAGHAIASGPGGLINGYWSPGYPALIAPMLWFAGPDWATAIPALHVVNLTIYFLAAAVFVALLRMVSRPTDAASAPPWTDHGRVAVPFGIAAFAVIALQGIGLGLLTPDFGVTLLVLVTAVCCFQVERSVRSWRWAAALGVVLGIGYWMKGILLPLNAVLLVALFIAPPRTDRARAKLALAALIFGLVGAPLFVLVSRTVGRVSAGEVGRLNYAWEIDQLSSPFVGWVGDPANRSGRPVHPPRVVSTEPQTLEFATPIRATYPLWFDPSYWYAGLTAHFDLAGQWRALRTGISDLGALLLDQWAVVLGMLALWLATVRDAARPARWRLPIVLGLWSAGAALGYASVHLEPRYLAGFVAIAVIGVWCGLARRLPRRGMPWVMTGVVVALLVSLFLNLQKNLGGFERAYRPDYLVEAGKLHDAGVVAGDHVAMVGDAYEAYAAFAAGTPITAQVMDSTGFWQLTTAARAALQARLAATGVKVMLANNVVPDMRAEGWRILGRADSSNLGVLLLRAGEPVKPP